MKRFSLSALVFVTIILAGLNLLLIYNLFFNGEENFSQENSSQKVEKNQNKNQAPESEEKNSEVRIILVGDIMLDRGVRYMIRAEGGEDFKFPFLKIAPYLQKADIVFGNLEGPITSDGTKMGSKYSFRDDPRCVEGLRYANFNVISLANNHILDYGRQGLIDTIDILKKNGILYAGAGLNSEDAFSFKVKEVRGTKIGFLAYTSFGSESWWPTEQSPGVAYLPENNFPYVVSEIKKAKKKVSVLIVSLHSGEEYSKEPTDFQRRFAKMAIDVGADIVVGHHPHVIQPGEKYKNGWIAYSLGNFIFDQYFSDETMKGEILEVDIKSGKIEKVEEKEFKLNKFYQPFLESLTFKNRFFNIKERGPTGLFKIKI